MVCELDLNQPKGAKSVPVWGVAAGLGGWREVLALLWYLLQAAEHTGIPWGHFRQGRLDTQPPGKADSISFVSLGPVAVPPPPPRAIRGPGGQCTRGSDAPSHTGRAPRYLS